MQKRVRSAHLSRKKDNGGIAFRMIASGSGVKTVLLMQGVQVLSPVRN